jgi:excisionase family DNA binding protein
MGVSKAKTSLASASFGGAPLSLDRVACIQSILKMSNTNEHSQVLTLKEAAAYLRVSKTHLANVINGKVAGVPRLRHAQVGRRKLIRREWVDNWLDMAGQE